MLICLDLQNIVMKVRMVPHVSAVFNRFPRMVHDISKGGHQEINLTVGEKELDRTVIDEIGDPVSVHLLRATHSIMVLNTPDERREGERQTVLLKLGSLPAVERNVVIMVTDDGAGINRIS